MGSQLFDHDKQRYLLTVFSFAEVSTASANHSSLSNEMLALTGAAVSEDLSCVLTSGQGLSEKC